MIAGATSIQSFIINLQATTSIFSIYSEASASEYLENIEEKFPLYYLHSDIFFSVNHTLVVGSQGVTKIITICLVSHTLKIL